MKATLPALDDHTEQQLEEKLLGFLNRWTANDFMPQFEKHLKAFTEDLQQDLVLQLRQRFRATGDTARGNPVLMKKEDIPLGKRSSIETEAALRLTKWDDSNLARIDTQELAEVAFDSSASLKTEFSGQKPSFIAYWKALRVRKETR